MQNVENVKIIFSRRVKEELVQRGFEVKRQVQNMKKPEFFAWEFERTPAFDVAFVEIAGKEEFNG